MCVGWVQGMRGRFLGGKKALQRNWDALKTSITADINAHDCKY